MSTTDRHAGKAGSARAVVLARYRPPPGPPGPATAAGIATVSDSEVHLFPLPLRGIADAINALCGTALPCDGLDVVAPGTGRWCAICFLGHVTGRPAAAAAPSPEGATGTATTAERLAAGLTYRTLGWPVTLRRREISLNLDLDVDAVAVVIPTLLSTAVTDTLVRRRCPPSVLAHPALPAHRVILAGRHSGVPPAWPTGVHRITGTVLLPPTVTAYGPLSWVRPPVPHTLQLCRELDVATALRTVLTTPPPPPGHPTPSQAPQ